MYVLEGNMNMQILPLSTKVNYQSQNQASAQGKINFGANEVMAKAIVIAGDTSGRLQDRLRNLVFANPPSCCRKDGRIVYDFPSEKLKSLLTDAQIPFVEVDSPVSARFNQFA